MRIDRKFAILPSEPFERRVADNRVNPGARRSTLRIEVSRIAQDLHKRVVDDVFRRLPIAQYAMRDGSQLVYLATINHRCRSAAAGGAFKQGCLVVERRPV